MYADVDDVLARAGVLAPAWDDSTTPGTAEIEAFLRQTAGEIDAGIAGLGYATPIDDPVAVEALKGYNADKALLLAIDATWPGSSARDDIADFRTALAARVNAADQALAEGKLVAVLVLRSGDQMDTGAANFWDEDGPAYSWWWDRLQRWGSRGSPNDPWGTEGPEFYRGMSL
jgi:hypothetical protein